MTGHVALAAIVMPVPSTGCMRGAPPTNDTDACAFARSSVATCGTCCWYAASFAAAVPGTAASTLPHVPRGSIAAKDGGSAEARSDDHGPFNRSFVVNQRPEARSHHDAPEPSVKSSAPELRTA